MKSQGKETWIKEQEIIVQGTGTLFWLAFFFPDRIEDTVKYRHPRNYQFTSPKILISLSIEWYLTLQDYHKIKDRAGHW
jgi:hypothetical protein